MSTVNYNTFCFATTDKVFYLVAPVIKIHYVFRPIWPSSGVHRGPSKYLLLPLLFFKLVCAAAMHGFVLWFRSLNCLVSVCGSTRHVLFFWSGSTLLGSLPEIVILNARCTQYSRMLQCSIAEFIIQTIRPLFLIVFVLCSERQWCPHSSQYRDDLP
jgi:hypothetical protein